jgi:hypothetical protein
MFPWFAIRVKPKHEKTATAALVAKGYESFLPMYLSRRQYGDRFKNFHLPLFAGYFFSRFDPSDRLPVLKTDSILSVLGNGKELIPIPDHEISALQAAVASKLSVYQHPFLNVGDRTLSRGPIAGRGRLLGAYQRPRSSGRLRHLAAALRFHTNRPRLGQATGVTK